MWYQRGVEPLWQQPVVATCPLGQAHQMVCGPKVVEADLKYLIWRNKGMN